MNHKVLLMNGYFEFTRIKFIQKEAQMKNILHFLLLCVSSTASANEWRMTINAKNETSSTVALAYLTSEMKR